MRNRLALIMGILTLAALPARADAPRVVADIAPVQSLIARVMEGVGEPGLIVPAGASPHALSLRPSQMAAVQEADLVVWVGPGLTPWLEEVLEQVAPEAARLDLMALDGTQALPWREEAAFAGGHAGHGHGGHDEQAHEAHEHDAHAEDDHEGHDHDGHAEGGHDEHSHDEHVEDNHSEGEHDHGHDEKAHDDHAHDDHAGHDHAGGVDAHAWLDPLNAMLWLGVIAEELAALDPEHADLYRANATAARDEIATLTEALEAQLTALSGLRYIVSHDAIQYFEVRFALPAAGAVSDSDAVEPGAARLSHLRDSTSEQDVACLLIEPADDPESFAAIFGEELRMVVMDPLGQTLAAGPGLYPALLIGLADSMTRCAAP